MTCRSVLLAPLQARLTAKSDSSTTASTQSMLSGWTTRDRKSSMRRFSLAPSTSRVNNSAHRPGPQARIKPLACSHWPCSSSDTLLRARCCRYICHTPLDLATNRQQAAGRGPLWASCHCRDISAGTLCNACWPGLPSLAGITHLASSLGKLRIERRCSGHSDHGMGMRL